MHHLDLGRLTAYVGGGFVSGMSFTASGQRLPDEALTLLKAPITQLHTVPFEVTVSDITTLIGCGVILWRTGFDAYKFWKDRHDKKRIDNGPR